MLVVFNLAADDRDIAKSYFHQAEILFSQGSLAEAQALLLHSIEFDAGNSEPNFLLARIAASKQETAREAIDRVNQAIRIDSWTETDPVLAQREYGRLLLQIKRHQEARKILSSVVEKRPEDRDAFEYYVRTLRESKDFRTFERMMTETLKRFPDDSGFYSYAAEYYIETGKTKQALEIIDTGIMSLADPHSLLSLKASLARTEQERKTLLDRYFKSGKVTPEACVVAVKLKYGQAVQYTGLFIENDGLRFATLTDALYALTKGHRAGRKILDDAISKYSGMSIVDENDDGFYEEKYVYQNGMIVGFIRDPDQDGNAEIHMEIADGIPISAKFKTGSGDHVTVRYSTYPAVRSAAFIVDDIERRYELRPFVYDAVVFQGKIGTKQERLRGGMRHPVNKAIRIPEETEVRKLSVRREDIRQGSTNVMQVMELLGGSPVVMKSDEDLDSRIDHVLTYSNGIPVSGKKDTNGDGIFESSEIYTDGRISKLTCDFNGDGKPDFEQIFAKDNRLTESRWDYTYDGRMDAIEYNTEPDTVVYRFSTKYNGTFDLEMTFVKNLLTDIRRNNRKVAIISGGRRNMFWIGQKVTGIEIPPDTPSGKVTRAGRVFFVFNFMNRIYIEEIR